MTEAYIIFKECYPDIKITAQQFNELFYGCDIIHACDEGVALVDGNTIRLLAVLPQYRNKGTGSQLLAECEFIIKRHGGDSVHIGGSPMCGATGDSKTFFAKHGYCMDNSYVEMGMSITDFVSPIFTLPNGVEYRFYDGTLRELHRAVADVDNEWVQYFTDLDTVFCGYLNGELASFCIIGDDELCLLSDNAALVGSVGCVGTLPSFRKQGIGLAMVSKATEYLRDKGCTKCFIHYTHLEQWYTKLGYKTFLRFTPMKKCI